MHFEIQPLCDVIHMVSNRQQCHCDLNWYLINNISSYLFVLSLKLFISTFKHAPINITKSGCFAQNRCQRESEVESTWNRSLVLLKHYFSLPETTISMKSSSLKSLNEILYKVKIISMDTRSRTMTREERWMCLCTMFYYLLISLSR